MILYHRWIINIEERIFMYHDEVLFYVHCIKLYRKFVLLNEFYDLKNAFLTWQSKGTENWPKKAEINHWNWKNFTKKNAIEE